jgi:hypothetical protein
MLFFEPISRSADRHATGLAQTLCPFYNPAPKQPRASPTEFFGSFRSFSAECFGGVPTGFSYRSLTSIFWEDSMFRTAGSRLAHSLALTAAAVALSFSFAGCSSSGGDTPDAGPKMCVQADVVKIFNANCTVCHMGTGYAGLDLTAASLPGLLDKDPPGGGSTSPSLCSGMGKKYLISHTNPAQGLLLDKLGSNSGCGARMPYGAPNPLSASDIACVNSWALTLTSP